MPAPIQRNNPPARHGLQGNQREVAKAAGILFPGPESREPGQGDEEVIFESIYSFYRVQINSPDIEVNLATGTKKKQRNDVIKFTNGKFIPKGPTRDRDIAFLKSCPSFGEPFKGLMWLRAERQALDTTRALDALTEQLIARPDLLGPVQKRLKELAGAGKKFVVPVALEMTQEQADADKAVVPDSTDSL